MQSRTTLAKPSSDPAHEMITCYFPKKHRTCRRFSQNTARPKRWVTASCNARPTTIPEPAASAVTPWTIVSTSVGSTSWSSRTPSSQSTEPSRLPVSIGVSQAVASRNTMLLSPVLGMAKTFRPMSDGSDIQRDADQLIRPTRAHDSEPRPRGQGLRTRQSKDPL